MKTFALYANVEVKSAPTWFSDFWRKYRGERQPYVTIKQTCFIEEETILKMKGVAESFFAGKPVIEKRIPVTFSRIRTSPDWPIIMLAAETSEPLLKLHLDLTTVLADFQNFAEPELKNHEENYEPHLTIATGLNREVNDEATGQLSGGCIVQGEIREIVLDVSGELTRYAL